MAIDANRAYQRTKDLYASATGVSIQDSAKNLLPYLIQAILEELYLHSQIQTANAVVVDESTSGGGSTTSSLTFHSGGTLEQT